MQYQLTKGNSYNGYKNLNESIKSFWCWHFHAHVETPIFDHEGGASHTRIECKKCYWRWEAWE